MLAPPSIIKAVPEGINKRLFQISSNEELFNKAVLEYQAALKRTGYTYQLKYNPDARRSTKGNKRKRSRNITWFNPPYDARVKTNVGVYSLITETSFPDAHILRPLFNHNTLKLSFSCMPNVKNEIDAQNKTRLRQSTTELSKSCNCHDKPNCPLNGECRSKSIIYQATVSTQEKYPDGTNKTNNETYVGLTDTEFKLRYANHKQSFSNMTLQNATELSKHVWKSYYNSSNVCVCVCLFVPYLLRGPLTDLRQTWWVYVG